MPGYRFLTTSQSETHAGEEHLLLQHCTLHWHSRHGKFKLRPLQSPSSSAQGNRAPPYALATAQTAGLPVQTTQAKRRLCLK